MRWRWLFGSWRMKLSPTLEKIRQKDGINLDLFTLPADAPSLMKIFARCRCCFRYVSRPCSRVGNTKGCDNSVNIAWLRYLRISRSRYTTLGFGGKGQADTGSFRTALTRHWISREKAMRNDVLRLRKRSERFAIQENLPTDHTLLMESYQW